MKLKKFVKHFNEYTEVEIYNDTTNRKLYTGTVYNIPKNILNYKMDNYEGVTAEVAYDACNNQYLSVAIPVLLPTEIN